MTNTSTSLITLVLQGRTVERFRENQPIACFKAHFVVFEYNKRLHLFVMEKLHFADNIVKDLSSHMRKEGMSGIRILGAGVMYFKETLVIKEGVSKISLPAVDTLHAVCSFLWPNKPSKIPAWGQSTLTKILTAGEVEKLG